jgi:hypothetical protein
VTAREELETYLNEDLRRAVVTDSVPIVDEDGKIFLAEIILRLKDGRKVAIVPEMRGKSPWLSLEIHDGQRLAEHVGRRGLRRRVGRADCGTVAPGAGHAGGGEAVSDLLDGGHAGESPYRHDPRDQLQLSYAFQPPDPDRIARAYPPRDWCAWSPEPDTIEEARL